MKNYQNTLEVVVQSQVTSQRDHSLAQICVGYMDPNGGEDILFDGYGSSSRDNEDKPNAEIGELLALSRALENVSAKIRKRANGLVRNVDNERAQKDAIANKKAAALEKANRLLAKKAKKITKKN